MDKEEKIDSLQSLIDLKNLKDKHPSIKALAYQFMKIMGY